MEKAHHRVRVARAQVEAEVKTKSQKSVYLLYKVTMYRAFLENLFLRVARAQAEADKARLDYELVRMLRCGEAKKAGIYFSPNSPYNKVCADIMLGRPPSLPPI